MKLSDLWPRAGAGKPATPVVSVTVTKRGGAEQAVATGNTLVPSNAPRGPTELPATLAECEVLEETLARDAIRLECQIGVVEGVAKAEKRYAEPWFIAMEVAEVLGYSDAYEMTKKLDDDEKQNRQIAGFGPRGISTINEPGLFSAILTSGKPEAKPFKRWVTHEVLPTIRRTGSYSMVQQPALPSANDATILIESMARTMKLAPSATLGMYQRYAAKIGHADLLPVYAIDAPDGDTSSHTTAALATLIKKSGLPVTARAVYLEMQTAGLEASAYTRMGASERTGTRRDDCRRQGRKCEEHGAG